MRSTSEASGRSGPHLKYRRRMAARLRVRDAILRSLPWEPESRDSPKVMAEPQRLPSGHLLVQMRAEGEGIIGDALIEIGPEHPDYAKWDAWLRERDAKAQSSPR